MKPTTYNKGIPPAQVAQNAMDLDLIETYHDTLMTHAVVVWCCGTRWNNQVKKNTKPIPVPHHATWIHANDKYHRECLSHPQGQVPWRKHVDFVQTCLNYFSTCNATWQARLHDEGHDQRWHGCAKDLVIECQTGTATWHCELTACPPTHANKI